MLTQVHLLGIDVSHAKLTPQSLPALSFRINILKFTYHTFSKKVLSQNSGNHLVRVRRH